MQYRLQKRTNPLNRDKQAWYAAPVYLGHMGIKEISKRISNGCTLTATDIQAVLNAFIENLPEYLSMGYVIDLGDLGLMRLSFTSKPVKRWEDFDVSTITGLKVGFVASTSFKEKTFTGLTYEPYVWKYNVNYPGIDEYGYAVSHVSGETIG